LLLLESRRRFGRSSWDY